MNKRQIKCLFKKSTRKRQLKKDLKKAKFWVPKKQKLIFIPTMFEHYYGKGAQHK